MSVFTPAPTLRRRSQVVKVRSGSGSSHLCPRKTLTFILYMILSIGFILLIDNQRVLNTTDITISSFEKPSTHVRKSIPLDRSNQFVSVESSNGDELQLPAGLETTVGVAMRNEIEQYSRAFPIWIEKRLPDDSNSHPYGWCVSDDLATNGESPKGLLFVKLKKTGSSTGAGVTLRIRDNLSKRLNHFNQKAPSSCFARYRHATARELHFQKRDPAQSFLWSIVREPAQRTLSNYFYFSISRQNHTATEDGILAVLKSSVGWNYQSKYLDLPSQNNEQSSSSTDRIINGYDFLAVNERMEESLVVLAMLAEVPLTDVVAVSSKIAGGYDSGSGNSCVKLKKKWTTPKIEEYILGDYRSANKDDYLLYNAAQRSLDKTIDALGRQRVEENIELLRSLQQQNEEQCASKATMPCPEPDDEEKRRKHRRQTEESCYFSDVGCGHACTDLVLADQAEEEWARITSSYGTSLRGAD